MLVTCGFQFEVTKKVVQGLYKGVSTVELDNLAAETAAALTTQHPDYAILAARIAVSNLHKKTNKVSFSLDCFDSLNMQVFSEVMERLYNYKHPKTGLHCPMVSLETLNIVKKNADVRFSGNLNCLEIGFRHRL